MALSAFKTSMANQMSTKCNYYQVKSNFHPYVFNDPDTKQIFPVIAVPPLLTIKLWLGLSISMTTLQKGFEVLNSFLFFFIFLTQYYE